MPIATIWPSGAQRIFAGANYSHFATADQRVKRVRLSSAVSSSSPEIGDITDYLKYPEYNIRLRGYHLGSDTFAWLDYNDNGRKAKTNSPADDPYNHNRYGASGGRLRYAISGCGHNRKARH